MNATITLQSHAGSRGACGYGPTTFPVLAETARLVADIGASRFVQIEEGAGPVLLKGLAQQEALGEFERAGDTIFFDGCLPFDDGGCRPPELLFDDSHVYVRTAWARPVSVPLVLKVPQVRFAKPENWQVRWIELSAADAAPPAPYSPALTLFRSGAICGASIDLSAPLTRCFHTVFEPEAQQAGVVIHDRVLAEHWFDPAAFLDAAIEQAKISLDTAIEQAQALIEQASRLSLPTSTSWTSPRSLTQASGVLGQADLDRVLILFLMRETLDRGPEQ